ncbi:hypothetical protein Tco_0018283 [Tanacetum coccineum]
MVDQPLANPKEPQKAQSEKSPVCKRIPYDTSDLANNHYTNEKQENLRSVVLEILISKTPSAICFTKDEKSSSKDVERSRSSLVFIAMMFETTQFKPRSSSMTSDHNRSELGIQVHSNEQSSSKLVPKVVP